jgi:hypothetical protein
MTAQYTTRRRSKLTEHVEGAGISDNYEVEVKGPDPDEWSPDEERPQAELGVPGLAIGEIQNEGTDEEIKGPGEVWEQDEGEYVNR